MTDSATMRVLSPLLLSSQYRVRIPTSVVLRSAIDGGIVPALGQPLTGYLRVHPDGNGSRVVVKLVNTSNQAAFMEGAWAMVLGAAKPTSCRPSPDLRRLNAHTDARNRARVDRLD